MLVITGAAGFIGSNLLARLEAEKRWSILAVDDVFGEAKEANVACLRGVTWASPANLLPTLESKRHDIQALVHLGAKTSTTATDRTAVFSTNLELSKALWTWCAKRKVPFIYASSASVYGDGQGGFDDTLDATTLNKLHPLNIYGESKLAFDSFVADVTERGDFSPPQWAGLRFFNVYGPNELHKGPQASVVSQMFPVAAHGNAYPLFRSHRADVADGEQKRDFIYVDDCVSVMLWLLRSPMVSGLFNVGTGQARSFLDLAKAVYASVDRPLQIAWRDTPEQIRDHYQYFTQADIHRLKAAGYSNTFTSLEDGVTMTIRNYLSQPALYR